MTNHNRLHNILNHFPGLHLLVVGDFFLDNYLMIDPALSETSLETGLEAYQVVDIRHSPGAAGTVTANLRAMKVQVSVLGVIGQDGAGFDLRQDLQQMGIDPAGLLEVAGRFTPTYTKPMLLSAGVGPAQELNRLDVKNRRPLPANIEATLIARLQQLAPAVDGIIITDQVPERNCGVITDAVRHALEKLAGQYPQKPVIADSRARIGEFDGVMLKPNIHEAEAALEAMGVTLSSTANLREKATICGTTLFEKNRRPVFVTLGAQGILVVDGQNSTHVPPPPVDGPIDIVGAGDSVLAGLTAALCAGATHTEAAQIGNLAASITIRQLGTTGTASLAQLKTGINEPKI